MSGHSKWSTIKHKKAILDSRRGAVFTKLGKAITIASRDGGADITSNFQLRLAVDKAKQCNMPNKNIERAIERGSGKGSEASLMEATYEGFYAGKISIIVEVVTDNKNRTAAEMKSFFEKNGGSLGQQGSVMFLFDHKARLVVSKSPDTETQMLELIDLGVEIMEEIEEGVEMMASANELSKMKNTLEKAGHKIKEAELVYKAKDYLSFDDDMVEKTEVFMEKLDELDDVQNVYCNLAL